MDRKNIILASVVTLGIAVLIWGFFAFKKTLAPKKKHPGEPNPICMLNGDIKNPRNDKQGFENLSNLVRLRFEVSNVEDCKDLCMKYCEGRMGEGFIPNLRMTFRANQYSAPSENFSLSAHCVFEKLSE